MEIFQKIAAQIASVGLPLYAVTLTAVPRADTPLLLLLHWHGFRAADPGKRPERKPSYRPVPGSALQLNDRWQVLEEIDQAMLEAGWQLGAWDVERDERRACTRIGASAQEALECQQAFGDHPYPQAGEEMLLAEAPDREALLQFGAHKGYVRWLFRPVRGGVWQTIADDDTLAPDGSRLLPCPVAPKAARGGKATRTVYRLGRISRVIVP